MSNPMNHPKANILSQGHHCVKIDTRNTVEIPFGFHESSIYESHTGEVFYIPVYSKEGKHLIIKIYTGDDGDSDKWMLDVQMFLCAITGKTWKHKEEEEDNIALYIYDVTISRDAHTWTDFLQQFDFLDTKFGKEKFEKWILSKLSDNLFWITIDNNEIVTEFRKCEDNEKKEVGYLFEEQKKNNISFIGVRINCIRIYAERIDGEILWSHYSCNCDFHCHICKRGYPTEGMYGSNQKRGYFNELENKHDVICISCAIEGDIKVED